MQVPAARHDVRKLWPAHEACEIALPPAALFHGIAEQHHRIGRRKANLRMEGELTLARPELDLDRAQRQAERDNVAPHRLEDRLDLIEARFGEIRIAGREQLHLRRLGWPRGIGRIEPLAYDLENVELDLEPSHVVEARVAELAQHLAIEMPGREGNRLAVLEIEVTQHPARLRRPWQHTERRGVGD